MTELLNQQVDWDLVTLQDWDDRFQRFLANQHPPAHRQLAKVRAGQLSDADYSEWLILVAPILQEFLVSAFSCHDQVHTCQHKAQSYQAIDVFKQQIVMRRAKHLARNPQDLKPWIVLHGWLLEQVDTQLWQQSPELAVADLTQSWLADQTSQSALDQLAQWAAHAWVTDTAKELVASWASFALPERLDRQKLIDVQDQSGQLHATKQQLRTGFQWTDQAMPESASYQQAHYCVYCHRHQGDTCSSGFLQKKQDPASGFRKNSLDMSLLGCPLEQKISEMHWLYQQGHSLAALAVIMVDNPLCAITGQRICHDCMTACIYQKQQPVDTPHVESAILRQVLSWPFGIEIYDLLLRWNPLRSRQWKQHHPTHQRIAVMGMGPAGLTMAYHLLMAGYQVCGFDGMQVNTVDRDRWVQPVQSWQDFLKTAEQMGVSGFGGVAEYGITARWDKRLLKVIYRSLLRFEGFSLNGDVRFGGNFQIADAWRLGFDHLVLATGAGLPKALNIPGSLAPGMRQASDFLMALHLSDAGRNQRLFAMQIDLPCLVIGGGLTAVDTATEAQAYYIDQILKAHQQYHQLLSQLGEEGVKSQFSGSQWSTLQRWVLHAQAYLAVKNCESSVLALIQSWGGVCVVYRQALSQSPAYRTNHHELAKAMEEGVGFLAHHQPKSVVLDDFGRVSGLTCQIVNDNKTVVLPARSIFTATGAAPNIAYHYEHRGQLAVKDGYYQPHRLVDGKLVACADQSHSKVKTVGVFSSYYQDGKTVSFIGDSHPAFHGSVVNAVASAKRAYPAIIDHLNQLAENSHAPSIGFSDFNKTIAQALDSSVQQIEDRGDWIVISVFAPAAAYHAQPGHAFRLQSCQLSARRADQSAIKNQACVVYPIEIQPDQGKLTFLLRKVNWQQAGFSGIGVGDRVSVMGPTGVKASMQVTGPTLLWADKTGLACTMSIFKALKSKGFHVTVWLHWQDDLPIWLSDWFGDALVQLPCTTKSQVDSRSNLLTPKQQSQLFSKDAIRFLLSAKLAYRCYDYCKQLGSEHDHQWQMTWWVDGPMQCLLKGICAQCLQWQVDPKTGERVKAVYSCSWTHQPAELVDAHHLVSRQTPELMSTMQQLMQSVTDTG